MGYTIPLDKRLAADGQGLEEVQINDEKAREAVAMRSKVQREELMLKEKDRKEQELCGLAQKARSERTGMEPVPGYPVSADRSMVVDDMRVEQQETRKETSEEREQRMECERERRLEARDAAIEKKSKITRDVDRDTSEKVSLGMANTGAERTGEVMYDQRLLVQEKGMDSGHVADGQYNIYDKGLFTADPTLSTLYRPKTDADTDMYGGADEQLEKKVLKTDRFKPDKAFTGASERPSGSKREKPAGRPAGSKRERPAERPAGRKRERPAERPGLSGSKRERPVEFITNEDCDIFSYEAVIARSSLKWRKMRLDAMDDDEIDGDGTSVLITDGYSSSFMGLYRI